MSGPELITLGCRLNIAESEAMRTAAAQADDLIIVNSCAVTAEAVKQARKAIRQAAKRRPDARIVVTGCAAHTDAAGFAAMPEVARVIGNAEKSRPDLLSFAPAGAADIHVSDIMAVRETAPHMAHAFSGPFSKQSRAFVEVQNGCDHRCTFCVIPYGRGNSRSVPAGAVIDRIRALVDEGHQEVVLTGVDLTSYGPDLPGSPTLGQLVERILIHVPGLARLRLSSLDSVEIDDRLFALLTQEQRIMPHLHLSLQAGDDMILKRMKRRHSRADAVAIVARLKAARPDIAIGADLIAGFPTEDEAMAANSAALIDDCDIVFGHVFPYSPRAGTPAARMPQLDRATIRRRAAALRARAEARRAAWLATLVGTRQAVLAERGGTGHAPNFAAVRFEGDAPAPGMIADIFITGLDDMGLIGRIA
ncbi:tRNA (N(6)-L-threonylcarbamoyladenosine(37)-C(2))-methylthiotransferase MtaB [Rhizorhabdus sp.]|uniref:tRNA (N(6)-L-threonylcarbamoyladenosine(37)-C(2))- methylthiotransferase MtaB n=1 Tax=Rhizorhabdus sp. TaxID=1968843 RepID=UPI0019C783CC|nr:tRNA (N(6)-L-threonylcarbamoyladenosine(37)-C(2))-methylthiotransferase MtaB [Rhizorhabdus sp.]MBD3762690.1 tRNA (N(6)-L-threonylcarbamoyladenosine(37)-C(2))-methylthiotransferase MtaB [Rhizorhabdus sp.]